MSESAMAPSLESHPGSGPRFWLLVLAVPLLQWPFLASGTPDPLYYVSYALLGACLIAAVGSGHLGRLRGWSLGGLVLGLAASTLLSPLPDGGPLGLQLKALLLAAAWLSVFGITQLLATDAPRLIALSRAVGLAAFVYSGSVYLALGLYEAGAIEFGEVRMDVDGRLRVFGPAGDHVSYLTAYFLTRSLALGDPLGAVFHAGALLLTGTRGAAFCALVGGLFVWWRKRRFGLASPWSIPRVLWWGLVVGVAGAWVLRPLAETLLARVATVDAIAGTGIERLGSIQLGWLVFLGRPLLGFGFNGFRDAVAGFDPSVYFTRSAETLTALAANQTTQVAADGGVLGLLLLGWFFAVVVRGALARPGDGVDPALARHVLSLQGIVVATVVGNQFAVYLLAGSSSGYFFLIAAAASVQARRYLAGVPRAARAVPSTA
jgi:hypothetical protein